MVLRSKSEWPSLDVTSPPHDKLEAKPIVFVNVLQLTQQEPDLLLRFSKFKSLIRITSHIFRFIYQCKAVINVDEINRAELFWAKYIQSIHFASELKSLKTHKTLSEKSVLKSLNPQLNKEGLIILHGRLQYADFASVRKFPVILPAKSHFSRLAIEKAHTIPELFISWFVMIVRDGSTIETTTLLCLLDTLKLKASLGARTYVFNQVIQ